MLLKQWVHLQAGANGVSPSAIYMRLSRGTLPMPPSRRLNQRVIEILPADNPNHTDAAQGVASNLIP